MGNRWPIRDKGKDKAMWTVTYKRDDVKSRRLTFGRYSTLADATSARDALSWMDEHAIQIRVTGPRALACGCTTAGDACPAHAPKVVP